MGRPVLFVNLIKKAFPGRFRVARLTRVSIVGDVIERGLFDGDDIIYLPKDDVVENATQGVIQVDQPIESLGDVVLPSQVVAHFIEQARTHWIMDFCICRYARCYSYGYKAVRGMWDLHRGSVFRGRHSPERRARGYQQCVPRLWSLCGGLPPSSH